MIKPNTPSSDTNELDLEKFIERAFFETYWKGVETDAGAPRTNAWALQATNAILQQVDKLITTKEQQARNDLLKNLAAKADKEYSRTEVDNWIFALGDHTRDELLKLKGDI